MGNFCSQGAAYQDFFLSYDKVTERQNLPGQHLYAEQFQLKIKKNKPSYQELLNDLRLNKIKFTDPSFKADEQSLGHVNLSYLPVWKRISEVYPAKNFCEGKARPDTLFPGDLNDSNIVSVLSTLAIDHKKINRFFANSLTHHIDGIYMTRLLKGGVYQQVIIDDQIPVCPSTSQASFIKPSELQFWPVVVQKSLAKLYGKYQLLTKLSIRQIMSSLSPAPVFQYKLKYPSTISQTKHIDASWHQLLDASQNHFAACAVSINSYKLGDLGLLENQSYTILSACEFIIQGQVNRLLRLRNPWGTQQWRGQCSDSDQAFWQKLSADQKNKLMNFAFAEDGIFVMQWQDFLHYFKQLYISKYHANFNYNFTNFMMRTKPVCFTLQVKARGLVYVTLHQPQDIEANDCIKNSNRAKLYLVIAKKSDSGYRYVTSSTQTSPNLTVRAELQQGQYLCYLKAFWKIEHASEEEMLISTYSQQTIDIKPQSSVEKDVLQKIFFNFVKRNDSMKEFVQDQDWVSVNVLTKEFGLAVIAVQAQSTQIEVVIEQDKLNKSEFKLKQPNKGKGLIKQTVKAGKPFIALAWQLQDQKPSYQIDGVSFRKIPK